MSLTKKQKRAVELLMNADLSKGQIAESVKVTRQTLWNWCNKDEEFIAELKEWEDEERRRIKRRIERMSEKALKRQEQILERSKNDNAAAVVAKDVLDRAGYMPEERVAVSSDKPVKIIYDIPKFGE